MIRQASAWIFALLLGVGSASAQQGTTEVRGRVLDAQGAMLPGATVTVRNQDTGMFRETVSGEDGTFFVSGIVPGFYAVEAALPGFKKLGLKDIRLEIGKTTTLDLQLAVGGVEETVSVSADTPLVDVTSKEVGGNITGRELVDLPSINRNFIGFIGLLPGIVPSISTESFGSDSISVNGSDPRNNNYMLDGGNNNDDVIGQRAGTQARTALSPSRNSRSSPTSSMPSSAGRPARSSTPSPRAAAMPCTAAPSALLRMLIGPPRTISPRSAT